MTDTNTSTSTTAIAETITITFARPIKLGEVEYTDITLTEPTAGQLIKSSKAGNSLEQLVSLINLNAAVPMGVVERMRQRDFGRCDRFFLQFDRASQVTSTPSSPT
jgi:hypothetical protein